MDSNSVTTGHWEDYIAEDLVGGPPRGAGVERRLQPARRFPLRLLPQSLQFLAQALDLSLKSRRHRIDVLEIPGLSGQLQERGRLDGPFDREDAERPLEFVSARRQGGRIAGGDGATDFRQQLGILFQVGVDDLIENLARVTELFEERREVY